MGLLKKIKDLLLKKKKLSSKLAKQNEENAIYKQKKINFALHRASLNLKKNIDDLASKYQKIDDEVIEKIEQILLSFDIGVRSTEIILNAIIDEIKFQKITDTSSIKEIIYDKLLIYYIQDVENNSSLNIKDNKINVILVVGVNGVGKTTTIAKLANIFLKQNKKVCLVAGDTFRSGAVEQLETWANKIHIPIYKPKIPNQDPASVIYTSLEQAKKENFEVIICDTSGRLQNKINLMNELKKINNVIKKFEPSQPCETLLVLDATTGQSGITQAKAFSEVTTLTGIILTKTDSTSKGGIILSIKDVFELPVKFIGVGEQIDDIEQFDIETFILGLIKEIDLS